MWSLHWADCIQKSDPSLDFFWDDTCLVWYLALLFPSTLYKSKYLNKFKPIYDAFWEPYKPKCHFYIGFCLIFWWIPFNFAFITLAPINVCLWQTYHLYYKWVNYIDAMFVFNLVLLFSGSLFFWSEYNSFEQLNNWATITLYGQIYSSFFIVLGFPVILVFIYHVIVRFHRLQKLTKQHLKKSQAFMTKMHT